MPDISMRLIIRSRGRIYRMNGKEINWQFGRIRSIASEYNNRFTIIGPSLEQCFQLVDSRIYNQRQFNCWVKFPNEKFDSLWNEIEFEASSSFGLSKGETRLRKGRLIIQDSWHVYEIFTVVDFVEKPDRMDLYSVLENSRFDASIPFPPFK